MLSESKYAAEAHILGGHLGNMLSIHIIILNALLCKKKKFQIFFITQIGHLRAKIQLYSKLLKFSGHFGLCKLGAFPYWDFLGLL